LAFLLSQVSEIHSIPTGWLAYTAAELDKTRTIYAVGVISLDSSLVTGLLIVFGSLPGVNQLVMAYE
jgi:hypothetical protein